ncbi:MAG: type II toxin-antitoxin system HipA family toxin [Sulfurovum sp.]|nr:type II toxin-antitoxin system HipA family toxin [Sulfurovum sp.]
MRLDIYYLQTFVGTLAQKNNKIYFEYDKEFLKTGIELSPYKLPLKAGVQRCDDDVFEGLWGLFADSLPDGWGRLLMDRHLMRLGVNPRSITPLDRLSYIGNYGMGALRYVPEREVDEPLGEVVLDDLAQSSQAILEGSSEVMLDELLALGGSSAGARPKVLVQLSQDGKKIIHGRQSLQEGYAHYMVKFSNRYDGIESGAIEYAYSLMAKEAGVEMPNTVLLEGKHGRYFGCERFDRVGDKRVHMHSVAGLTHSDFRFPTLDYDDLMALTLDLTKNYQELHKMFRLACFNLFAHNRDDHAKNFSFLMDDKGVWRLSPAYDLTFSYGVGAEHSTMYMGEGLHPTKEELIKLGEKHKIKGYANIIDEVQNAVCKWSSFAKEAGVSAKSRGEISKILKV